MDNWNYPPGSDTPDAPWNQPDAPEPSHYVCDNCDHDDTDDTVEGQPCPYEDCGGVMLAHYDEPCCYPEKCWCQHPDV